MEVPKLGTHTKKAVKEHIRSIANAAKLGVPLAGDDHVYLMELFPRHSLWTQKRGVGVDWVEVREVRQYGMRPTRCFHIIRKDGSVTDISWVECVNPTPHYRKVAAVFRHLIANQMAGYRYRQADGFGFFVSPIDGKRYHESEAHVDHVIPFETLMSNFFAEQTAIDIADVELLEHGDNDLNDELKVKELGERWQRYHREHAVLRLITIDQHKAVTKHK
jgi:hypothetical protein